MDELTYELLTDPPVMWGDGTNYLVQSFTPGGREWVTQDQPMPLEDGTVFGVDFLTGPLHSWSLTVRGVDAADTMRLFAALETAWLADEIRSMPGKVVPLRLRYAGSTDRRVYGRPRAFTPVLGQVRTRRLPVVMDFQCVDHRRYSDAEHGITVGLVPPPSGGLVPPWVPPLSTVPPVSRPGTGTHAGVTGTWPRITFHGPVQNPSCRLTGGWEIGLTTSLAFDQSVTIDPAPWQRTVLRNDGATLAGALTRQSPAMPDMKLPPGDFQVVFTGSDDTNTAQMTFNWRDAYTTF